VDKWRPGYIVINPLDGDALVNIDEKLDYDTFDHLRADEEIQKIFNYVNNTVRNDNS